VLGLGRLARVSVWAGATGHGVAIGAAIVVIGALLVISAFRGGARWLIVPALALALPLAAVAASDIRFGDGIGQRHYRPATFASIPADGYDLGIGELKVDLRELPWSENTVLDLNVDLGVGELAVAVPENVCVSADVDASAGSLDIAGDRADGIDTEIRPEVSRTATPRLNLTGEVDFGELRVFNLNDVDLDDHGPWRFRHGNDDEMRTAMDAACSPDPAGPQRPDAPKPPRK
jgi:predicted membrane protein